MSVKTWSTCFGLRVIDLFILTPVSANTSLFLSIIALTIPEKDML